MKEWFRRFLVSMSVVLLTACGSNGTGAPGNTSPTIDTTFEAIELQENSGTTNYEFNVSDSDGDQLTLSVESNDTSVITVTPNWTNPLLWAEYNGETLDFNLTTVTDASGPVRITITVDDGAASATTSFDVNVTAVAGTAIKKTGQTESYDQRGNLVTDGSLKDDGFYQKGVDHNYTRDDTNDIVTDHVTGLMWQDDDNVSSVTKQWLIDANYNTCTSDTSSDACCDTTGDTAATYCADLSLGGYNDWRLPTAEELEGIVDYGKDGPAVDIAYFNHVSSSYYWSSTTFEYGRYDAWIVGFSFGNVGLNFKVNSSYVRCVRDGQ